VCWGRERRNIRLIVSLKYYKLEETDLNYSGPEQNKLGREKLMNYQINSIT